MMEWFQAGGWGMFAVLILGAGGIGFGVKAIGKPTAERLAWLRTMPALIGMVSLFTFGTNMWAVNVHLSNDAFLKARNISMAEAPLLGVLGVTEAAQVFTLGGLLAAVVLVLRMIAEAKKAKSEAA